MFRPPISMVIFSRDRHPANHCSFTAQGGDWPPHCVEGTLGYELHPELVILPDASIVDKGTHSLRDQFDAFDDTGLAELLTTRQIQTILICGLATEYCVKETALGSIRAGFDTWVMTDAIAAVNRAPGDEQRAILEMRGAGINLADSGRMATILHHHHQRTALIVVDVQNDFCPGGALGIPEAKRIFEPIRNLVKLTKAPSILGRVWGEK